MKILILLICNVCFAGDVLNLLAFTLVDHDVDDRESCGHSQKEDCNETKELEKMLKNKEELLRKLKLVKMYRAKVTTNDQWSRQG